MRDTCNVRYTVLHCDFFCFGHRFHQRTTSNLLLQTTASSPCPPSWTIRYTDFFLLTLFLLPFSWQSIFSTLGNSFSISAAFFDRPCLILGRFPSILMIVTGGYISLKISKWYHQQHTRALGFL